MPGVFLGPLQLVMAAPINLRTSDVLGLSHLVNQSSGREKSVLDLSLLEQSLTARVRGNGLARL